MLPHHSFKGGFPQDARFSPDLQFPLARNERAQLHVTPKTHMPFLQNTTRYERKQQRGQRKNTTKQLHRAHRCLNRSLSSCRYATMSNGRLRSSRMDSVCMIRQLGCSCCSRPVRPGNRCPMIRFFFFFFYNIIRPPCRDEGVDKELRHVSHDTRYGHQTFLS